MQDEKGRTWLRFLTASQFNYDAALKKMTDWLEWRASTFPIDLNKIKRAMDLGFVYIGKRDQDYRPTIVVQSNRLFINEVYKQFTEKELCDCVAFTIGYAIDNLLIPGKVETLNLLFDATDLTVMGTPLNLIKNISSVCLNGFPTRINRTFVVGLSFFLRKSYSILYYFLPEFTRNVFIVVTDSELKKVMSQWYDLRNVMVKFGGTLPNQTTNFFPPDMAMHN